MNSYRANRLLLALPALWAAMALPAWAVTAKTVSRIPSGIGNQSAGAGAVGAQSLSLPTEQPALVLSGPLVPVIQVQPGPITQSANAPVSAVNAAASAAPIAQDSQVSAQPASRMIAPAAPLPATTRPNQPRDSEAAPPGTAPAPRVGSEAFQRDLEAIGQGSQNASRAVSLEGGAARTEAVARSGARIFDGAAEISAETAGPAPAPADPQLERHLRSYAAYARDILGKIQPTPAQKRALLQTWLEDNEMDARSPLALQIAARVLGAAFPGQGLRPGSSDWNEQLSAAYGKMYAQVGNRPTAERKTAVQNFFARPEYAERRDIVYAELFLSDARRIAKLTQERSIELNKDHLSSAYERFLERNFLADTWELRQKIRDRLLEDVARRDRTKIVIEKSHHEFGDVSPEEASKIASGEYWAIVEIRGDFIHGTGLSFEILNQPFQTPDYYNAPPRQRNAVLLHRTHDGKYEIHGFAEGRQGDADRQGRLRRAVDKLFNDRTGRPDHDPFMTHPAINRDMFQEGLRDWAKDPS